MSPSFSFPPSLCPNGGQFGLSTSLEAQVVAGWGLVKVQPAHFKYLSTFKVSPAPVSSAGNEIYV